MKTFSSAFAAGRERPGAVVALGKFDGLHRGHRRLLRAAARSARALAAACLVVTFDPSPEAFFGLGPGRPLTSRAELPALLGRLGVDGVVFLPFGRALACQAPRAFARDVLARALRAAEVWVGEDFCFGRDRAGRVEHLADFGREYGYRTRAVPLLRDGKEKISSSRIRVLLARGDTARAERLLGRRLPRSG